MRTVSVKSLRVMTYNIRNGRGSDGRIDLGRIADVVAGFHPDVLAVQEVDVCRSRSGGIDQATELGARLGMTPDFAPCVALGTERTGIATLTRIPVESSIAVELPHHGRGRSEPRRALITRLRWADGRALDIVNTHLSVLRNERTDQVAALAEALGDDDLVVAGDLNCTPWSACYRALSGDLEAAPGGVRTWPAWLPLLRLDHLLYRGAIRVIGAGAWTRGPVRRASDHLPVVAEFEPVAVAA